MLLEALINHILSLIPAELKYDAAVALREGSYIRGQDYKVEGYNKAIKEIKAVLRGMK